MDRHWPKWLSWHWLIARYGSETPRILLLLALVIGGTWGFIELADEVVEGSTQTFDEWVVKSLRRPDDLSQPIGPTWMAEVGRDLTALGGISVLVLMIVAVSGYLYLARKYRALIFTLIATGSGLLLSLALKSFFARPRPALVPHLSQVYTASFPSGHAMLSAVVYLTLGALLVPLVKGRLKIYVLSVALTLTFLVGLSRIYMGVHYPTDVLAGWTAGLVWATLSWLVLRWLQRHGRAETEADTPPETSQSKPAR